MGTPRAGGDTPPLSHEQQLRWLYDEQERREKQAVADQGAHYVHRSGGWITVAYEVLQVAPEWVADRAKREYLRCNFLPMPGGGRP